MVSLVFGSEITWFGMICVATKPGFMEKPGTWQLRVEKHGIWEKNIWNFEQKSLKKQKNLRVLNSFYMLSGKILIWNKKSFI